MQNLRYYCRQRIEALTDKQCKFGSIFQVRFEHIIVQREKKISYDSFSNLKSYWNERVSYQRTVIHTFLQHEGNIWTLLSVKLTAYKRKIYGYVQHFTLFDNCWFIRMLVIVGRCPRKWFLSNDFHAFQRFEDLQSWAFLWKLIVEQYFKLLANKSKSFF